MLCYQTADIFWSQYLIGDLRALHERLKVVEICYYTLHALAVLIDYALFVAFVVTIQFSIKT